MSRIPNLENLDKSKTIFVEEIADEGNLERALRHYGNWLKQNKHRIGFLDRAVISERGYKVVVMYQLKDECPKSARFRRYRA